MSETVSCPLKVGMADADDTGTVRTLQTNLNRWRATLGNKFGELTVDGAYGPDTASAVVIAQEYWAERGVAPGICEQVIYDNLAEPLTPPVPPVLQGLTVTSVLSTGVDVTLTWDPDTGVSSYRLQIEYYKDDAGWVPILNTVVVGNVVTQSLSPRMHYRWRAATNVDRSAWSGWVSFVTP